MAERFPRRLYRSSRDRMLGGVCGGLGEYFDVDPVLMRLIFVALTVLSGGLGVPAYLVLWIVIPREGTDAASRPRLWRQNADEIVTEARRLGTDVRESVRPRPTVGLEGSPANEGSGPAPAGPEAAGTEGAEPSAAGAGVEAASDTATAGTARYVEPYSEEHVHHRRQTWAGVILVVLGLWLLANNFHLFWWVRGEFLLPLALLGVGAWLLLRRNGRGIG